MSLPCEKTSKPTSIDISDLLVFAAHNSSIPDPKGKRKRLPDTNYQVS